MKKREFVDLSLLRERANHLMALLQSIESIEPQAAICLRQLQPLLDAATSGEFTAPVKDVPCGHLFHFDTLRKYDDLEDAYSKFAFTASGIDDKELFDFMRSIGVNRKS